MFNLDQAIADWRRQMLAAGIKTPVPLDELESHLREDLEQQMQSGKNATEAFAAAIQRIGQAHALQFEFAKTGRRKAAFQGQLLGFVGFIFVGFIVWLSAFTFFKLEFSPGELTLASAAVVMSLLVAGGWGRLVRFLPVLPNQRKRTVIGLACILLGFGCSTFFVQIILPHFERHLNGQIPAIGFWAVFPIAVFSGLGLGLMMSAQDREHWGMKKGAGRPATAGL